MELCPVLRSSHVKRERLQTHLQGKQLSMGAWVGEAAIVGDFFPLNISVLSFHNEQAPLKDKYTSAMVGATRRPARRAGPRSFSFTPPQGRRGSQRPAPRRAGPRAFGPA